MFRLYNESVIVVYRVLIIFGIKIIKTTETNSINAFFIINLKSFTHTLYVAGS